jgi:hypothetical protein
MNYRYLIVHGTPARRIRIAVVVRKSVCILWWGAVIRTVVCMDLIVFLYFPNMQMFAAQQVASAKLGSVTAFLVNQNIN